MLQGSGTVIFFLLLVSVFGCGQRSSGNHPGDGPELGRKFTVERGDQVEVSGERLEIRFASVASDSRCPKGAECIQQGCARILLRLARAGENAASVGLNTTGEGHPSQARYLGYEIKLLDLEPYPRVEDDDEAGKYRATLLVREAHRG